MFLENFVLQDKIEFIRRIIIKEDIGKINILRPEVKFKD